MKIYTPFLIGCISLGLMLPSCSDDDEEIIVEDEVSVTDDDDSSDDDDDTSSVDDEADYAYVGLAVGNFDASEWYPGGELGTTTNKGSTCYEDPAPAVEYQGLEDEFNHGEYFFEKTYTLDTAPFAGLGPAAVRSACLDCHPGYGHGKRQTTYSASWGNGYLLVVYHPDDGVNSNDGDYITECAAMPQTIATSPFLPPLDESGVTISWETVTEMESGLPMTFPDGETYELIYPVVTVDLDAFNTDPKPSGNIAVRLESTIGVLGVGLLDAVPADSIKAHYQDVAAWYQYAGLDMDEWMNSEIWDASANDFAETAYSTLTDGYMADGGYVSEVTLLNKYTYAMSYASIQENSSIWSVSNVSREDYPYLYSSSAWAKAMSENADVIAKIKADSTSPYYADGTDEGIANAVRVLLDPETNQFDNDIYCFEPEMDNDDFYDFMVWHRGLAIPRARNLHNSVVQRGKEVFTEIGCTNCHRPSWTTGDDNYWSPAICSGKALPRFQNQTIYPYTDFMQHKLYMINDIHGSWCRTTPRWGRGLSLISTGSQDRLHDCRARNEIEAIMWHAYSSDSHAYESTVNFYNLSTEDREAVIKFIKSI